MNQSVFVEFEFWLLVIFSIVIPVVIIWICLTIRRVSHNHVLVVGLLLVTLAGIDIYLLQALKHRARETASAISAGRPTLVAQCWKPGAAIC